MRFGLIFKTWGTLSMAQLERRLHVANLLVHHGLARIRTGSRRGACTRRHDTLDEPDERPGSRFRTDGGATRGSVYATDHTYPFRGSSRAETPVL